MHFRALIALLLFLCTSCKPASSEFPDGRIIDLSHTFDSATIFWPTEEGFRLEKGPAGYTDKGYYYTANRFCGAEHGGTHIDAPIHFAEARNTVDRIPLEQLMGIGIVVDVSDKCEVNADYQVSPADLEQWENANGQIPDGCILLLRTGFGKRWPDRTSYLGTAERGAEAVAKLHFPGLAPETARWLVANRAIKAIGLDTASVDYGQSTLFESHQVLFKENVPAFENLANLDQLPALGFSVIALPMKIGGGSGGPLRAVAIVER